MKNLVKNKYKFLLILGGISVLFFASIKFVFAAHYAGALVGKILIQTEKNGEAWYVYPVDGERYYLGRPADAFRIMRQLSLGATHEFITTNNVFPARLAGRILLDVEASGKAYYIDPVNLTKHFLNRPADAFAVMRKFGLGVTNLSLLYIPVGHFEGDASLIEINVSTPIQSVPFTSQAPFGDWSNQRQQDGCEEASALMAIKWAKKESLIKEEALDQITGISDFLQNNYGEYRDISTQDAIDWIFKDYFNYDKVALKKDMKVDDIIYELSKGNIVLTPMDGQIMHNPNFRAPGPPRHMIVIKGYNADKKVFITNDPGTRLGDGYEYDARVLFEAIRDYPTGYHELIHEVKKNMIIVWR